jgi:hypothetical protein
MGDDHWHTDPRFQDDQGRGDHDELVSKLKAAETAEHTTDE